MRKRVFFIDGATSTFFELVGSEQLQNGILVICQDDITLCVKLDQKVKCTEFSSELDVNDSIDPKLSNVL